MSALTDLQAEVREVNEANGWFDRERPFSADIALLHSEVSELDEAIIKWDVENIAEELADIVIRLLDTAERHEIVLEHNGPIPLGFDGLPMSGTGPAMVRAFHRHVSAMYEGYRNHDSDATLDAARDLLSSVALLAGDLGVTLQDEIDAKLERNRSRGYRHGGKAE